MVRFGGFPSYWLLLTAASITHPKPACVVHPLRFRQVSEKIQLRLVTLTERMTGRKQIFHTAKNASPRIWRYLRPQTWAKQLLQEARIALGIRKILSGSGCFDSCFL